MRGARVPVEEVTQDAGQRTVLGHTEGSIPGPQVRGHHGQRPTESS